MPQTNRPGACPLAALLLSLLALLLLPTAAHAAPRVALLIGNQAYAQGGLRYPGQDVGHIKAALLDIGFQPRDVVVLLDADQKAVKRALSAFGERARGAEVAFLYYSGHATQARGQNWLIPIGAEIRNEADYEIEAVSAQGALAQLQEAAPALSIVVLDACRDNPVAVTKSGTKGLGRMDAGASTVLAYATAPNSTAADNGLYAQVLAAQLRTPGLEILDVFRNTGAEVRRRTGNQQAPRMSEVDLPRRVYLNPNDKVRPVEPATAQRPSGMEMANQMGMRRGAQISDALADDSGIWLAVLEPNPRLAPLRDPDNTVFKHKQLTLYRLQRSGIVQTVPVEEGFLQDTFLSRTDAHGLLIYMLDKHVDGRYDMRGRVRGLNVNTGVALWERQVFDNRNWGWAARLLPSGELLHFSYQGYLRCVNSNCDTKTTWGDMLQGQLAEKRRHAPGLVFSDDGFATWSSLIEKIDAWR